MLYLSALLALFLDSPNTITSESSYLQPKNTYFGKRNFLSKGAGAESAVLGGSRVGIQMIDFAGAAPAAGVFGEVDSPGESRTGTGAAC
jgi:hypothetical protein